MRRFFKVSLVLVALISLGLGVFLASVFRLPHFIPAQEVVKEGVKINVSGEEIGQLALTEQAFITVAEKVRPSVVHINVESTAQERYLPFEDPFFEDFLRRFFGEIPREYQRRIAGQGSGFIVDSDGYIITNNHVVQNAQKITVKLLDGRSFSATVVGQDSATDLAVLKVEKARDLPVVTLGDSSKLRVGQWAIAIGNPFGLDHTVTVGIISAIGRSGLAFGGPSEGPIYQDFIQTDASINFGNSGGPLCNIRGEVIGVNAAINPMGQGIGFAIPINLAKNVFKSLIKQGKVVRGWLGVYPQDIDERLQKELELPDREGVLIAGVIPSSPAEKIGIREGDVVRAIDGRPIKSANDLMIMVAAMEPGTKVKISLLRDKKDIILEAAIGERPAEDILAEGEAPGLRAPWRGITVSRITPDLVKRYSLQISEGVVITGVEPNSSAKSAGLREGDIILQVNRIRISNLEEFISSVRRVNPDEDVVLRIRRGRGYYYVVLGP